MVENRGNENFCPDLIEILNGVPHGIALVDQDLRIIMMNRFLEALTGYSGEEVRGIYCDHVLRTGFGRNVQVFRQSLDSGVACSIEGDILGLNREKIPMRFTATPVVERTGGRQALVLVLEDIADCQKTGGKKEAGTAKGLLGHSPKMQEIFELLPVLAHTDSSVLITGETGTGKDILAEAVHLASRRSKYPFIKVNCGALPESLLESELFGHVRGAFTGAHADKHGMFQLAQGGTIFLTEIGDLPLPLQVKLLTVLDDREFFPLGSQKKVRVDVRLITGTHRDLKQLVEVGRFREDLFFRLNVLRVHLPPLRERDGDVRLLIDYFLQMFAASFKKNVKKLSSRALRLLGGYRYPGNVRELRNIIEYGVNICRGEVIDIEHLPPYVLADAGTPPRTAAEAVAPGSPLSGGPDEELPDNAVSWSSIEKRKILTALMQTGGSRTGAAKALGWGRTTLWRKMREYDLG
ncbi:MAG: sigma 54-interacting transcriptional regulator [Proteobacteria bacterium]|nr:sigma 54-interacting transcriptional regulator [Pseudomonadota bacterium]MBU2619946.1 sigma 54-interacting transcriptional regulator [Pseudomonadota bacterium]